MTTRTCPIEPQEIIDEVELAAHSAYAGTRKQDILMEALRIVQHHERNTRLRSEALLALNQQPRFKYGSDVYKDSYALAAAMAVR